MATPDMLKAKEHADILNVIDEARSFGVGHFMDLPQIIVCGDQSSGKSSVLNAISNIQFPKQDELCTRFATEVSLRRGSVDNITVSIIPSDDRTEEEKQKLCKFARTSVKLEDIERLTNEATAAIGIDFKTKRFSSDVLKFEVTGPEQPQLTLVDLPGLFQAGSRSQTDQDASAVRDLVLGYMRGQRSIILAVVSAKNDVANQIVTRYAREVDPNGERTLGIITKPDTLHPGSGSEAAFVQLAQNQNIQLRRGWHVVKNRDFDTRHESQDQRDESEERFFNQGIWRKLSKEEVGVASLRKRLSFLLRDQIVQEFPGLMREIVSQIEKSKHVLVNLGPARTGINEQKAFLLKASYQFSNIINAAVNGSYSSSFFGSTMFDEGREKRLRAVIQHIITGFSERMEDSGHAYIIVDESEVKNQRPLEYQQVFSEQQYFKKAMKIVRETKGLELPGSYNPSIVGELFYDQAFPWKSLVQDCIEDVWNAVRAMIDLLLAETVDAGANKGIRGLIIDPSLNELRRSVESMKSRVLSPHLRGHPITYNRTFLQYVQQDEQQEQNKFLHVKFTQFFKPKQGVFRREDFSVAKQDHVEQLVQHLSTQNNEDSDYKTCRKAYRNMGAYYTIARQTLVDNLGALVIEDCIMQELHKVFSPEKVAMLNDEEVAEIAAESEETQRLRGETETKLEALEKTIILMRRLDRSYHKKLPERTDEDFKCKTNSFSAKISNETLETNPNTASHSISATSRATTPSPTRRSEAGSRKSTPWHQNDDTVSATGPVPPVEPIIFGHPTRQPFILTPEATPEKRSLPRARKLFDFLEKKPYHASVVSDDESEA